jgi:kynureninase
VADLPAITDRARRAGATVLWDLSHGAGIVPARLTEHGADIAVGCTYKYLHAGPGAPAYVYVRREMHDSLRSPISGWFGQHDQFAMAGSYTPAAGVSRFQAGTPSVLGLLAVDEGVRLVAEAGIDRIRATSLALTSFLIGLADAWLAPLGFAVSTPREPRNRGGHVGLRHADAGRISVALRDRAAVIADFRPPDVLRLAPTPLDTRFVDVWDGLDRLRRLVESGGHRSVDAAPRRVT